MYTGKPKIKVKGILSFLRKGEKIPDNLEVDSKDLEMAQRIIESERYVETFKNDGGKFLCSRLRPGFIGNVVNVGGVSSLQTERGKPYGTVVAIANKVGTVTLGVSYISPSDKDNVYPIVGLAIALKKAIEARDMGLEFIDEKLLKNKSKSQVGYFIKRSLAYFNPNVYSYSRGQEGKKVEYDNYEEIHRRRKMILGE